MLHNLNDLNKRKISATDGDVGQIKDFYFQDDAWVLRYIVVDTGSWLDSREVLISPISVRQPDWLADVLPVGLTKSQVAHSPPIDTDQPVTRQNEAQMLNYYGYPYYWGGGGMWDNGMTPYAMVPGYVDNSLDRAARNRALEAYLSDERDRHRNDDPHLRSCKAVTGYHIHATDGDIGHVAGFLVDDETWAIRYLVIDTSNWWLGHKVLVAPAWIKGVHWADKTVSVDLSRASIKTAPPYDERTAWGRDQESGLYQHHGRRAYWAGSPVLESGN